MKLGMARVAAARARVNLPTVWSNVLAGVICRARRFARDARHLCAILSLFYVLACCSTMRSIRRGRARATSGRSAGHVRTGTVFIVGAALLAAGIALLALRSAASARSASRSPSRS